MKIVVFSDSHGKKCALDEIIKRTRSTTHMYIHLGDGEEEIRQIMEENPELDIHHVAGNCDWYSHSPAIEIIEARGIRIFATHGHRYGVNGGVEKLCLAAQLNGCQIVLFGHTHCRFNSKLGGMYVLNPGSCSQPRDFKKPSFATIDITTKGIVTNITDI